MYLRLSSVLYTIFCSVIVRTTAIVSRACCSFPSCCRGHCLQLNTFLFSCVCFFFLFSCSAVSHKFEIACNYHVYHTFSPFNVRSSMLVRADILALAMKLHVMNINMPLNSKNKKKKQRKILAVDYARSCSDVANRYYCPYKMTWDALSPDQINPR